MEDEGKGKKRLIHEAREKKQLLLAMMDKGEIAFSVVGGISKAHRRFKHKEEEHVFLGCQIDEASDVVYVNKVGAFGVTCASYWWTRVEAAELRDTRHLLGKIPLDLLLYADDLQEAKAVLVIRRSPDLGPERARISCLLRNQDAPLNKSSPSRLCLLERRTRPRCLLQRLCLILQLLP